MKNIITSAFMPLLAVFAFGCTSTTALQTSENDDLYYASSDKTVRQEMGTPPVTGTTQSYSTSGDAANPEYSDPAGQTNVTNNYNYYDNNSYYSSSRGRRYTSYSYSYYNDPFYSPFGYSAAYCYGIYDPFWYPGYYPYSGITVSIGYGYGYGYPSYGYGYGRPYGYRPYDYYGGYYGGGYGGYYQGFYDGYYAGNGAGYGYGYHRNRVNYAPRNDRSNVPGNVPSRGNSGRPDMPGRQASTPYEPGRSTTNPRDQINSGIIGGRPERVTSAPGNGTPSQVQPATNNIRPEVQPGRQNEVTGRPGRNTESIRPENYQFQEQPAIESARPVRSRGNEVPMQQNTTPVIRDEQPGIQPGRTVQEERPVQAVPEQRPSRSGIFSRPAEREVRQMPNINREAPTNYERPTYRNTAPSYNNNDGGRQMRSGGRPRN